MFTRTGCLALLLTSSALSQDLPSCYVSDTSGDTIWFLSDLDANGDYNGAAEVVAFYDDALGPIALSNNAGMKALPGVGLLVTDTTEDIVVLLRDLDANGDAYGVGEATVWFDGTAGNPTGVELTSGRGLHVDDDGVVWVASANTSSGVDAIVRLEDINADGDANDVGEQLEYYLPSLGGSSTGDSIPASITRGPDGALYYVETGSTGFLTKGVYRLEDLDASGTIDQPGEATPFFLPTTISGNSFFWDISVDDEGYFLIDDTGDDVIRRFRDDDANGSIDELTESSILWAATGSSLIWNILPIGNGEYLVSEDQTPDRMLRFVDANSDGVIDVSEESTVYDETVSATNFGSPKAIVVLPRATGTLTIGCDPASDHYQGDYAKLDTSSFGSGVGSGLHLEVTDGPTGEFGFFLTSAGGSASTNVFQGVLCLDTPQGRYNPAIAGLQGLPQLNSIGQFDAGGVFQNIAGTATSSGGSGFDVPTEIPFSPVGTVIAPGDTWYFQCWYRDQVSMPGDSANFSNMIEASFP